MTSHCVVVWEYQSEGQWLPHTPGVTRTLERAHTKKLTRVVLADADPALKGHYVNLRTLTQCQETSDGGTVECPVRRACYSAGGAGGRGARWEWAPLVSPPLPAELTYEPMPMEQAALYAWDHLDEYTCLGDQRAQPARLKRVLRAPPRRLAKTSKQVHIMATDVYNRISDDINDAPSRQSFKIRIKNGLLRKHSTR